MDEKAPFFSVIVPEHNSEAYMKRGLDSIREQSFEDYELIVICDACDDNTAEIAKKYTDNVVEVDYKRAGLARNEGLDRARGEWILFMDDDDWFLHEFAFEIIANAISSVKNNDYDMFVFDFIWRHVGYVMNNPERPYIAPWNKVWRRSFIGESRFPDWEHSDDKGFAKMMHAKAKIFPMSIDSPLYYYNFMREGSIADRLARGELKPLEE